MNPTATVQAQEPRPPDPDAHPDSGSQPASAPTITSTRRSLPSDSRHRWPLAHISSAGTRPRPGAVSGLGIDEHLVVTVGSNTGLSAVVPEHSTRADVDCLSGGRYPPRIGRMLPGPVVRPTASVLDPRRRVRPLRLWWSRSSPFPLKSDRSLQGESRMLLVSRSCQRPSLTERWWSWAVP